jgi:elongation factor 1-beta
MMGEVAMIYRIMPESPEVMDGIKKELDAVVKSVGAELNRVDEKPIAFGLKALEIAVIMDDKSGKSGELEEKISSIPGVQSMELVDMSLI